MRKCAVPKRRAPADRNSDRVSWISVFGNWQISTWPSTSVAPWIMQFIISTTRLFHLHIFRLSLPYHAKRRPATLLLPARSASPPRPRRPLTPPRSRPPHPARPEPDPRARKDPPPAPQAEHRLRCLQVRTPPPPRARLMSPQIPQGQVQSHPRPGKGASPCHPSPSPLTLLHLHSARSVQSHVPTPPSHPRAALPVQKLPLHVGASSRPALISPAHFSSQPLCPAGNKRKEA